MLLSAVSVLVVAQSSSEISEGLMNNPVFATGTMSQCELEETEQRVNESVNRRSTRPVKEIES